MIFKNSEQIIRQSVSLGKRVSSRKDGKDVKRTKHFGCAKGKDVKRTKHFDCAKKIASKQLLDTGQSGATIESIRPGTENCSFKDS